MGLRSMDAVTYTLNSLSASPWIQEWIAVLTHVKSMVGRKSISRTRLATNTAIGPYHQSQAFITLDEEARE